MAPFKIAAVQTAPVFLNREATVSLACDLIAEAAANGARLIVFPEAFLPAYPDWVWAIPPGQGQLLSQLYAELVEQSITIPDAATERLCRAAKAAGVYVVVGVNERNSGSGASLYNTMLYLDPQGRIMGKHRKLVPTGPERMVWAQGDGSTLQVYETELGRIGGLICWENYMPLARYTLFAWGVQLYLAPTWDRGKPWLATLQHIAREGRVYVVGCSIAMRTADIPDSYAFKGQYYAGAEEWINKGDSAIVDPEGNFVAGPLHKEQGILYAEVDPGQRHGPKWYIDVAGHYARPDVFQLTVQRGTHPLLEVSGDGAREPLRPDEAENGAREQQEL